MGLFSFSARFGAIERINIPKQTGIKTIKKDLGNFFQSAYQFLHGHLENSESTD